MVANMIIHQIEYFLIPIYIVACNFVSGFSDKLTVYYFFHGCFYFANGFQNAAKDGPDNHFPNWSNLVQFSPKQMLQKHKVNWYDFLPVLHKRSSP